MILHWSTFFRSGLHMTDDELADEIRVVFIKLALGLIVWVIIDLWLNWI